MRHWFHALSFLAALVLSNDGIACTAEKMKTTDNGFIFKVVGGSDRVEAKDLQVLIRQLSFWISLLPTS